MQKCIYERAGSPLGSKSQLEGLYKIFIGGFRRLCWSIFIYIQHYFEFYVSHASLFKRTPLSYNLRKITHIHFKCVAQLALTKLAK